MYSQQLVTTLTAIHQRVRSNFITKADIVEEWRMPPQGYDGSQTLEDDCDGFCLACRSLLRAQNLDSRLVYCEIPQPVTRKMGGHLVVEVHGWILDYLQDSVAPNTGLQFQAYDWLRISGYQAGAPWRRIHGFDYSHRVAQAQSGMR